MAHPDEQARERKREFRKWWAENGRLLDVPGAMAQRIMFAEKVWSAACTKARQQALEEAAQTALTTPYRAHRDDDVDFHSGCVQTKERIVEAIRSLRQAVGEGKP